MNRIYFAQNPIIYRYTSDAYALMKVAVSVYSYPYNDANPKYTAEKSAQFYDGEARINLSDIAISVLPYAASSMPTVVSVEMKPYKFSLDVSIYDANGDLQDTDGDVFYAFQGGISNAAFRKLETEGKNVFDHRLLTNNPFLTNASVIRLTEATMRACPLYIYTTQDDSVLRVVYKDKSANDAVWEYQFSTSDEYIRALNLPALLAAFEAEVGLSPHVFRLEMVGADGILRGAYITIEQKPPTAQQRVVLWRNSWGVFEATQLNGQATRGVEAEKEEYLAYDDLSDSYTAKMQRGELITSGTATTGYRTKEELLHLLDLYASHEHYLLNPDGTLTEVVLTSTSAELSLDSFEPQEHTVEWKLAVNEDKITVL